MRISDWSSDVCSSDLTGGRAAPAPRPLWPMDYHLLPHVSFGFVDDRAVALDLRTDRYFMIAAAETSVLRSAGIEGTGLERKSVVSGKSVSVRVDTGGRPIINKKKKQ